MRDRLARIRGESGNAVRVCAWDDCELETLTRRHAYCSEHRIAAKDRYLQRRNRMTPEALERAREYDRIRTLRRRESGEARRRAQKYGQAHKALRDRFAPYVEAGGVCCARCGNVIEPGTPWDLGHVDGNPSAYAGPEHARCNRQTSTHKARRRYVSRAW